MFISLFFFSFLFFLAFVSCCFHISLRVWPFQSTLGRVTIQIDKVVAEGVYSGLFSLNHDSNKDGSSRTLEIEIIWSNGISNDDM